MQDHRICLEGLGNNLIFSEILILGDKVAIYLGSEAENQKTEGTFFSANFDFKNFLFFGPKRSDAN